MPKFNNSQRLIFPNPTSSQVYFLTQSIGEAAKVFGSRHPLASLGVAKNPDGFVSKFGE